VILTSSSGVDKRVTDRPLAEIRRHA